VVRKYRIRKSRRQPVNIDGGDAGGAVRPRWRRTNPGRLLVAVFAVGVWVAVLALNGPPPLRPPVVRTRRHRWRRRPRTT
jgi:hypothetical protein